MSFTICLTDTNFSDPSGAAQELGVSEQELEDGLTFTYDFHFVPAERMTWDYPGCPAHIEDLSVKCSGIEVVDLLDGDTVSELEYRIMKELREAERDQYDAYCDHLYETWREEGGRRPRVKPFRSSF